jgi:flagellin
LTRRAVQRSFFTVAAQEQVISAQSSIQDADFAAETANLTRAQVLVQAGNSVLAIANQQPTLVGFCPLPPAAGGRQTKSG